MPVVDVVIDNEEPSSSVNTENLLEQVRRSFSLSLDLMPPKEPPKRVILYSDNMNIYNVLCAISFTFFAYVIKVSTLHLLKWF